ncbi:amidase signature enzyme [Amniculicola lignicola CBS 123094]|uniref:Amidase signature enzyme n=1 Tax=Amniculicola lignicola CBS 123094 TaxID=1392246 RepID=A0A6A5WD87_9PLEO|nr:amidase signature enzyme [Amniculicola lignicola CBS 123094]
MLISSRENLATRKRSVWPRTILTAMTVVEAHWESKAAAHRAFLASRVPNGWRVPVLDSPKVGALNIHNGIWSSEVVTTAFCERAAVAKQWLNWALHGLPISVKKIFDVPGTPSTFGFISCIEGIAPRDGLIVALRKEAGTIPFIKTNISQRCLLVESSNNIFGTVLNPWNPSLSAGGSPGCNCEGVLVAFRGSPLGVGTDGRGPLRTPAAWNGVCTIKPSSAGIPGGARGNWYSDSTTGYYGPFANGVINMRIWMQAVLGTHPWLKDPGILPMPWNTTIQALKKLNIGLLLDDGIIDSSPPLRNAGHEVLELGWATLHRRATEIIFRIYTQEGGVGIREQLEKSAEPLIPRTFTARKGVRNDYMKAWQELWPDTMITAPYPHPAPPHGQYITSAIPAMYNLLDYPCCIIPPYTG